MSSMPQKNLTKFAILIFSYPKQCVHTALRDLVKIVNKWSQLVLLMYDKLMQGVSKEANPTLIPSYA